MTEQPERTEHPSTSAQRMGRGVALATRGELDAAIVELREAARIAPDDPWTHFNLGHALSLSGRPAEAVSAYREALRVQPVFVEALNNLGGLLAVQGDHDEAVCVFEQAIEAQPDCFHAVDNLARLCQESGRKAEAIGWHKRALELRPVSCERLGDLAVLLAEEHRLDEAIADCHRAIALDPGNALNHNNLGQMLAAGGRFSESAGAYARAVELRPDFFEAIVALAGVHQRSGRLHEAVTWFRRGLTLRPDSSAALGHCAVALTNLEEYDKAAECCRRAIELDPAAAARLNSNLGCILVRQYRTDDAIACFQRALAVEPGMADVHNNLASALKAQGRIEEALAAFHRALAIDPEDFIAHSNLLNTAQYATGVTPESLAAMHGQWQQQHAARYRADWRPHDNPRDPDRLLRVGFISADFRGHPVGRFFVRSLEALSASGWLTHCYHTAAVEDGLTQRIRAAAGGWTSVVGESDHDLAERIRADRIDILIELSGHTQGNRLLALARRPAPIQMTWIGYEGTTGLEAIDYLIADARLIPPGCEAHCSEKVIRLPETYVTFDPSEVAAPVGPLPAISRGHVTLASFNNPAKITPEVVAVWAEILRRLPTARLLLRYGGFEQPGVRDRYGDLFAAEGIQPSRLECAGAVHYAEFLAEYNRVDLALDPFPFTGGATTCEAMWMGVPVVTLADRTFAGRHGCSYLHSIGLDELVADDVEAYIATVVGLAGDLPWLAELRGGLRSRMGRSPLCDGTLHAARLGTALREAWRRWCDG